MTPEIEAADFYFAGGTLRPGSPSYVKRPADEELFEFHQKLNEQGGSGSGER